MNLVRAKLVHAKAAPQAKLIAAATIWTTLRRWGGPGLLLIGIVDSSFIPTLGSLDIFNALLLHQENKKLLSLPFASVTTRHLSSLTFLSLSLSLSLFR